MPGLTGIPWQMKLAAKIYAINAWRLAIRNYTQRLRDGTGTVCSITGISIPVQRTA